MNLSSAIHWWGTPSKYNLVWGLIGGCKELFIPELGKMSKVWFTACITRENLGIAYRISFDFKLFTFPEDCGLTSLLVVKIIYGRLSRPCNLRYHCVNSCKVLFSYQVSWVIIMASQVYYGFMLFNMIALSEGNFLTLIALYPHQGGKNLIM